MIRATILGCGSSGGVPRLGGRCLTLRGGEAIFDRHGALMAEAAQ